MTKKLTTEAAVYEALRNTYEPPAYAVLPGVANGTGSHKSRTIDAVIMSLWPSRGQHLHGIEIKVSRNDWVRELADPAKQESHFKHMDYFWLAVGDESIVRDGELPETWGLLVPARTKLKVIKPAPLLKPEVMTRAMLAAILRRANEHINSEELRAGIKAEVEAAIGDELASLREDARNYHRGAAMAKHGSMMARFCDRAGVRFDTWNTDALDRAADVVKALGIDGYRRTLASIRIEAERTLQVANGVVEDARHLLSDLVKLESDVAPEAAPDQGAGEP